MRFSIWPASSHSWPDLLRLAHHAADGGWDGVWIADHFMPNGDHLDVPMLDCFAVLSGFAAAVPRVRLGSLVAGNTYRHPAVLMNAATTIDHISGGRFVLGIGAGWQQNEHDAYGIDLPAPGRRLRRLEEACRVITCLHTAPRTTVDGEFYRLTDAAMEPKPAGSLPLLIGGSGQRVMPRIVARYADEWNAWGTPETFAAKTAVITKVCEESGRDPSTLRRSTQALVFPGSDGEATAAKVAEMRPAIGGTAERLVDVVGAYAAAGVDELIVPDFQTRSADESVDLFDFIAEEVAPAFR